MHRTTIGIAAAAAIAAASSSFGVTLTAGSASATILGGNGTDNFSAGDGGGEIVYQSFWALHAGGVSTNLVTAGSHVSSGATGTVTGSVGSLSYSIVYTLVDGGPGAARLDSVLTLINNGVDATDIDAFSYTDYDLDNGSSGNDSATYAGNVFSLTDAVNFPGESAEFGALNPDGYESAGFASLRSNILNDSTYDLSNVGDFGPGDWTGAFQWTDLLAAGESISFASAMSINMSAQVVPLPAPVVLAGLGLFGAAIGRRRFSAATA